MLHERHQTAGDAAHMIWWVFHTEHAQAPIDQLRNSLPPNQLLVCWVFHVLRGILLVQIPAPRRQLDGSVHG